MKKKLLSCALAAVFSLSMCTTAFAETITADGGSAKKSVYGTATPMADAETVYKVDVSWGSMQFAYNAGAVTKTWNPNTHSYDEVPAGPGVWSNEEGANKVTVTNHSNIALAATVEANISEQFKEMLSVQVTGGTINLDDASAGASTTVAGSASSGSAEVAISGEFAGTAGNNTVVGTVTLTIADAE